MKSAMRGGSWMLPASVASSSESVGESSTTRWKNEVALCASALTSISWSAGISSLTSSTWALRNGRYWVTCTDAEALDPLDHQPQRAVREAEHLVDVGERARGVEVALERLVDGGVALRQDADDLALLDRVVDERHGALAGDRERQHRLREQQRVAQRQDADLGRQVGEVDLVNAGRLEVRLALVAQSRLLSRGRRCAASRSRAPSAGARRPWPRARRARGSRVSSWQSRHSSAKGSARRRAEAISCSHSWQRP